jgi:hypothetical protein
MSSIHLLLLQFESPLGDDVLTVLLFLLLEHKSGELNHL